MQAGRVASVLILMVALAAPVPAPSGEAEARRLMEAGLALQAQGRNGEAVEQLSQAIASHALSPADTARAYYDRGVAYDGAGNMAAAVADYGEALRLDPGLAPAYNNRGNVHRRAGRIAEAKRDYSAALKCQDAAREYPYFGLGLIAAAEGDSEGARDLFHKALAANPAYTPAQQALATLDPPQPVVHAPAPAAPAAPAMPEATKPVPAEKRALVQLGAFGNEALARRAWAKIAATAPDALQSLVPVTETVDLPGKGRLWRLRTAVSDKADARRLCAALTQRGQACVPVP